MRKYAETVRGKRIAVVLAFFFIIFAVLLARLFILQIVNYGKYRELASRQHAFTKEIPSERGSIFVQNKFGELIPAAFNKKNAILSASPRNVANRERAADFISDFFKIDREEILRKISDGNSAYKIVSKNIDGKDAEKFEKNLPEGFFFERETRRIYPYGKFASQTVGFVSRETDEENGRSGIEKFYNKELAGKSGFFAGVKDAGGFWVALGKRIVNPPQNGADILLTVDYNIQLKAEEELAKARGKWEALSGNILVVEPATGKILAIAGDPSFDPNEFNKEKDFSVFLNPLTEARYELGSVLKPIVMAGGLEEGLLKPDTTYNDPGEIKIGGYTIRNFDGRSYNIQTMTQVLEKSLNTGAVYAAKLLGGKKHYNYLASFGFDAKTGIDLPGEVGGDISSLKSGRDINFATASFGQGIAVTPLGLAMAIGSVANGGKLMKPYLVEKIIYDSGNEVKREPQTIRRVVSKENAEKLTTMLVSAVRNGFENRAGVKGYFVAGKTGTAQIPKKGLRGYSDKVIHTFVGYAPAFNPKFLILLQLNEPKGNRFAANTLTPVFRDLAEYILNYYEIPPDEK